ncbi:DUF2997 domain-containing protein [Anabaena azotica]|uniref:DUF2997 domain-containing protein n=1 Tax=Anabaena azotica FACHB-119 TaxID=947527 RepID=A0ABR8CYE4_9NOST|nr:DUF2997 domain-containing protein [Anabaena azotica]MBD2499847.1 DUF2997 domain-containing protein [Anabaena azotica FACHB-119]
MQYRQVQITIAKDGTITEQVINGVGNSCTELTAGLENELGKVESQELLPEYYQQSIELQTQEDETLWQSS